ncbi:MAG: DUF4349 domain-containing protein [Candidatus Kapabacteria bacterium]|nr:DUF4349 domain-containing protein [Ignavibacteriota bacterium]MCW5885235.1 DUF4349 domain-containing protein [Candidatus Kapabacteria bacterium]
MKLSSNLKIKFFSLFFLSIFSFLIISCGGSSDNNDKPEKLAISKMALEDMPDRSLNSPVQDFQLTKANHENLGKDEALSPKKMLIKNGNVRIKVSDVTKAKNAVDKIIENYDAYYINENLSKDEYRYSYYLTIKIPSSKFDEIIRDISKIDGSLTELSVNSEDVTQEYFDLEIRLGNKSAYLDKYRDILKQAKTIKEILEVEEKIRIIEEEIESVKGRIKYLSQRAAYSTLSLDLYQVNHITINPEDGFFSRILDSFIKGWKALTEFIIFTIVLWPFIIIFGITGYIVYRIIRKSHIKKS